VISYPARELWLLRAIGAEGRVEVLNDAFLLAYAAATGAEARTAAIGGYRCRTLASDLSKMHSRGWLKKSREGMGRNWRRGGPKWVNVYALSDAGLEAWRAVTATDWDNRVFAVSESDGPVQCHRCLQLGTDSMLCPGSAFLAGPLHSPYDGNAHYFCRKHLDKDAVICGIASRKASAPKTMPHDV